MSDRIYVDDERAVTNGHNTAVRSFIVDELCDGEAPSGLTDDTLLLEEEILDSLGIFEIVGWIEETMGGTVPVEAIVVDNFRTITAISDLIRGQLD